MGSPLGGAYANIAESRLNQKRKTSRCTAKFTAKNKRNTRETDSGEQRRLPNDGENIPKANPDA